jgi:hypothetical protein
MRPSALLPALLGRLDVAARRIAVILFAEAPVDRDGRHHPALRSGRAARASARIDDRWYALLHLFAPPRERGGDRDVSGVVLAPSDPSAARAKDSDSGRNAAA